MVNLSPEYQQILKVFKYPVKANEIVIAQGTLGKTLTTRIGKMRSSSKIVNYIFKDTDEIFNIFIDKPYKCSILF